MTSLLNGPTLSLKLAEPFVFVTAPPRGASAATQGPVLVRGLLVLKLPKPTKITSIDVVFDGRATTDWPEGIGARRLEVSEHIPLVSLTTSFLDSASTDRRAWSLGPGIRFDEYDTPPEEVIISEFPRSSNAASNTQPSEAPSRTTTRESPAPSRHNSERAASVQPTRDPRPLHTPTSSSGTPYNAQGLPQTPRGETPPYTPRTPRESLPSTPLAQSPIRAHGFPEELTATASTSSQDASVTRDRGRTFTRVDAIETGSQAQHAAYEREYDHPPDRYPESVALDPEGGIDEEDHPISVIPEDPDPVEHGHLQSTVNVRSNPTTGPPSAASSVNNIDLTHVQSSLSSSEHSGDVVSTLDATRSLPNVDMSRIPSHSYSNHSQRPSLAPLSRQTSSQRSSTSPATTTRPLPASTNSLDRQSSPTTSSNSVHINRARTASGAPGDQSPSRGSGRHNRFSFSAVTHILREVSHDMRDAVGIGSSHHNAGASGSERGRDRRSRSRAPETPRNLSRVGSRADDVPATPLSPTTTLGGGNQPWTPASEGFVRAYGRGGAGSLDRDHTRSRTRGEGRHPADRESRERYVYPEEEDGRRGRDATVNPLGDAAPATPVEPKAKHASWKEFSRGTYTYPISFAIPSNLPPSLSCDFGSVSYRLKATVHRAGTFAPKLTASVNVQLVSCLGPDSTDDLDTIIVQRMWEDKLSYVVHVEGTAFPIGSTIPINITLMPLDKISLYRVSLAIDVDYYAHGRKVARHEPVQHYEMIAVRQEDKQERLLPIISDSPSAAAKSPLAAYARPEGDEPPDLIIPPSASQESLEHTSDVASHLLNPSGPWHLKFNLKTPDCNSGIHFTNREHGARIVILHRLKTTLRVAAGVFEPTSDPKERPKLFDIIIETPIHLLSCQCQSSWTHLPTYSQLAEPLSPIPPSDARLTNGKTGNAHHHHHHHAKSSGYTRTNPILVPAIGGPSSVTGAATYSRAQSSSSADPNSTVLSFLPHTGAVTMRSGSTNPAADERSRAEHSAAAAAASEALSRSSQFARLVAGEESEAGEQPPAYST